LPDAALAVVRGEVASVSYPELEFSSEVVKFVEGQRVPSDTKVVEYTWRYVNKSGDPDRRFINNAELPVCLYGELTFRSAGGLSCKLQVSNPQAVESPLYKVVEALRRTSVEIPTAITYIKTANHWPTTVSLSAFVLRALLQAGFFVNLYSQKASENRSPAAPQVSRPSAVPSPNSLLLKPQSAPLELKLPPIVPDSVTTIAPSRSGQHLDLSDPQNVVWVQSRLRESGFLRGATKGWDSFSRSALRDFKTTNSLAPDDEWDFEAEKLLASGQALRVEQTFVGSWSEAACETGSRPDVFINSRRAVSSAGGVCEFSNVRALGSSWTISTACTNAGEKWKATIQLTVSGDELVWTGRNGSRTHYQRCQ
jgi:hypothetical protein